MRSLFEIVRKRCNSNDGNSACEAVVGELRATLLRRGGGVARVRPTHHARGRIRQNVDPFSQNSLFHRFSPNGSALWWPHHRKPRPRRRQSGELRHPRLRHAGDTPQEGFAWRKTPIATNLKCAASPPRPAQGRLARKISPNTAPPLAFPRKSSPGKAPTPALPRKSSPSTHKNAEFGPI